MDATVVIPNYNGIKYLDECLKSLYAGSVIPYITVVDNGSSDGSFELVQERYKEVRLIRFEENKGFCAAVNAGISLADTPYVILLNNDTRADQLFVERLIKAADHQKEAFSIGARMMSMSNPDRIDDAGDFYCALGWAYARGKGKRQEAFLCRTEIFAACAGAALYRKSVLDEIGYFDENHFAYLEDIDIGYRAKIKGYKNYYEPEAVVFHAGSAVSGSRHNAFKVSLASRNSIYLIYKNMPILQILLNVVFLIPGFLIKSIFFAAKGLGGTYVKGLKAGISLSLSEKGKSQKLEFEPSHWRNYMKIQGELWVNLIKK